MRLRTDPTKTTWTAAKLDEMVSRFELLFDLTNAFQTGPSVRLKVRFECVNKVATHAAVILNISARLAVVKTDKQTESTRLNAAIVPNLPFGECINQRTMMETVSSSEARTPVNKWVKRSRLS
jgi:hypothetical protein